MWRWISDPQGNFWNLWGIFPLRRPWNCSEKWSDTAPAQDGSRAGADLVLIETMSDSYEAKAAVLAAKENCDLPVLVTVTFDGQGKMLTGGSVDSTVALLEGLRVDALGVNCGLGPEQMIPIVERLTEVCSIPVRQDRLQCRA